ncbi:MAG: hypothetical protein J5786_00525 [Clostridiales bacterium]|nr:hypothetical protein [Clostridiales bacterium]
MKILDNKEFGIAVRAVSGINALALVPFEISYYLRATLPNPHDLMLALWTGIDYIWVHKVIYPYLLVVCVLYAVIVVKGRFKVEDIAFWFVTTGVYALIIPVLENFFGRMILIE